MFKTRWGLWLMMALASMLGAWAGGVVLVGAHGDPGANAWVSVTPRAVHVSDVGTVVVTFLGGGFGGDVSVEVYGMPLEDASSGCVLDPGGESFSETFRTNAAGELDATFVVRGTGMDVAGDWAICAREGDALGRGDVFRVVDGPMLSMGSSGVGLGGSLGLDGRGFSAGQTVTVYAVEQDGSDDSCGERCVVRGCPAFNRGTHTEVETVDGDADGNFADLDFLLSRDGFAGSTQWGFCAFGGGGERTTEPLHVHLSPGWGAGDDWVLRAGEENTVWFWPRFEDVTLRAVSIGGFDVTPLPEVEDVGGFSEFTIVPELAAGTYTLSVELNGREDVEHPVEIVGDAAVSSDWTINPSVSIFPSGGDLTVSGNTPDGVEELTVYGIAPSESGNLRRCPAARGYAVLGTGPVRGDNTYVLELDTGHGVMDEAGRWALCATDGGDSRSVELVWVEVEPVLEVLEGVLYREIENEIALLPRVADDVTIERVTFDGEEVSGDFPLAHREGMSVFVLEVDAEGGGYVLEVVLSDGTELSRVVAVSATSFGALAIEVSPDSVTVGDVVSFSGVDYAPGLSVKVYVVPPGGPLEDGFCPDETDHATVASVEASADGAVGGSFEISKEVFDRLGIWSVCAVDGAGGRVEAPAELVVNPGMVLEGNTVVRFVEYRIEIQPELPAGTTIESMSFGGAAVAEPGELVWDGDYPYFAFSTERDAGKYTLVVVLTGDYELELVVEVTEATHEPVLSLSERVSYGERLALSVTGHRANAVVELVGVKSDAENAALTCEEIAALEPGDLDYVWAPEDGAEEGADLSDESGGFEASVLVEEDVFAVPGAWGFCLLDRAARVYGSRVGVELEPSLSFGSGDGRVMVGSRVEITVNPTLKSEDDVGYLRVGGSLLDYVYEDGVLVWEEVPRKPGTYELAAEVHGIVVYMGITVLSGVPPGLTVRSHALECPGLTEFRETAAPGVKTPATLRFRVDADGVLQCFEPELKNVASATSLLGVVATTVLPSDELVIEFDPAYGVPGNPRVSVLVSSYDNEYGYRLRPEGVTVVESARDDRNHRMVIPGCASWVDTRGAPVECEVALAKDLSVLVQAELTLPDDASEGYPTQVVYGESAIWDLVEFGASMEVVQKEVSHGESFTVDGKGFPRDERLFVYGANLSLEEPELPEGEDEWTCGVLSSYGELLAEVPLRSTDDFTAALDTGNVVEMFPGRWVLCVVAEGGLEASETDELVLNYSLVEQAGGIYESGRNGYVRVKPGLPESLEEATMTVGGDSVDTELRGDEVHFTAPRNKSGSVKAVVEFNDGLESSIALSFKAPEMGLFVRETDGVVRIGTLLELSATGLTGDAVCEVTLGGVELAFVDDGHLDDGCAVVGANRKWSADVVVVDADGEVSSELVELFEQGGTAVLKLVSSDEEEMEQSVSLLRPRVDVVDEEGKEIEDNLLVQFEPVKVRGYDFPKENAFFDGVAVGYEVRDERSWGRVSLDGTWTDTFRVTKSTEEGRRLEFVPLIGGHRMESLAFVLTVGVSTPTVTMEPGTVETGTEVTVSVTNLLGYVAGYRLKIVKELGGYFPLSDAVTGETVNLVTDRDGAVEYTFAFPDYEADHYDSGGNASLEIQLFNPVGEAIPEAIVRITHRIKEEPAPTPVPDIRINTEVQAEEVLVEKVPFPEDSVGTAPRTEAFLPTPTPFAATSRVVERVREGAPEGVDHSKVLVEVAPNGRTVTLAWIEPVGEFAPEGYLISRALTEGAVPTAAPVPHYGTVTRYVDLDVVADRRYWYYIVAYNDYGLADTEGIVPVEATTPGAPGIVARFEKVGEVGNLFLFEWDPPVVEEGRSAPVDTYVIEGRAVEGGDWTVVERLSGEVTSGELRKFGPEGTVRYRITGVNGVGRGPWQEWQRPVPERVFVPFEEEGGLPWLWIVLGVVVVLALVGGYFGYRRWSQRPDGFTEKPLREYDAGQWSRDEVETPPWREEAMEAEDDGGAAGPYSGRLTDEVGEVDESSGGQVDEVPSEAPDAPVVGEAGGEPEANRPTGGGTDWYAAAAPPPPAEGGGDGVGGEGGGRPG